MRIWSNTTKDFLKLVASEERYARLVGGTEKKARFKSKARTDERNNKKIRSNNTMRKYLDGVAAATTANTERMQEILSMNKSKDNQLVEMMVRLDAKMRRWSSSSPDSRHREVAGAAAAGARPTGRNMIRQEITN